MQLNVTNSKTSRRVMKSIKSRKSQKLAVRYNGIKPHLICWTLLNRSGGGFSNQTIDNEFVSHERLPLPWIRRSGIGRVTTKDTSLDL